MTSRSATLMARHTNRGPMRRPVLVLAVALALLPQAAAHDEADAGGLWPGTEVDLDPDAIQEGDQFRATLRPPPDAEVASVDAQVCIVAESCIIAFRPAEPTGDGGWRYDTASYRDPLSENPVVWRAGERVGVEFRVVFGNGTERIFPAGVPENSPECKQMGWPACSETHYFALDVHAADNESPPVALPWLVIALGAVGLAARAWPTRGGDRQGRRGG